MEEEEHSFRVVGDKNHRQENFSTSVILTRQSEDAEASGQKREKKNPTLVMVDPPVFVVYDGVDEGIVDGGGLCNDCRDSLGVWC